MLREIPLCQAESAHRRALPQEEIGQVRDVIRLKHYSIRSEQAYIGWIKRYIHFCSVRHPAEMGAAEVEAFLTHLTVKENVAASTQNQAFSALFFFTVKCCTRSSVLVTPCSALADRRGEGNALWNMGLALEELGERERAIDLAEQPLALFDAIEDPRAEKVRRTLAEWRGGKKRRWWQFWG